MNNDASGRPAGRVEAGRLEMGDLPQRWQGLARMREAVESSKSRTDPRVMTDSLFDEARPGGHRLYPSAERALSAAEDCNSALQQLLTHHGATATAMWALMRTEFEASFWAYWLLSADEGQVRVLRGINLEWMDHRRSSTYHRELADAEAVGVALPSDSEDEAANADKRYAREARANGARFRKDPKPADVNMTAELAKIEHSAEPALGPLLRATWRDLCGLQHGSAGALLRASDSVTLSKMPGVQTVRLSPNDGAFQRHASLTYALHALALYALWQRHEPHGGNGAVDLRRSAFWPDR